MVVKEVLVTSDFENRLKRLEESIKAKVKKQIHKIIENPEIGKPLKWSLKGNRVVRVPPYRLVYSVSGNKLIFLRLAHRKKSYKK